jgi:hypothetical protein
MKQKYQIGDVIRVIIVEGDANCVVAGTIYELDPLVLIRELLTEIFILIEPAVDDIKILSIEEIVLWRLENA